MQALEASDIGSSLKDTLDTAVAAADRVHVPRFMAPVVDCLFDLSRRLDPTCFAKQVTSAFREHPLGAICREDPYTRHCLERPRGIAGDAALMDFIYGHNGPTVSDTARGAALCTYFMSFDACESVRFQRGWIAAQIDALCASQGKRARIAAVGCGHFREAAFSMAITERRFAQVIALDQDALALEHVEGRYAPCGIECINQPVLALLRPGALFDDMDLIYAAGAYNYLAEPQARQLTLRLAERLRTGGRLVFSNFLPDLEARGYMQAAMNWTLIYRSVYEAMQLLADIPANLIQKKSCFVDPLDSAVHVIVERSQA